MQPEPQRTFSILRNAMKFLRPRTLFSKMVRMSLAVLLLCGAVIAFVRVEVAIYSRRDDARMIHLQLMQAQRAEHEFVVKRQMADVERFQQSISTADVLLGHSGQDGGELRPQIAAYQTTVQNIVAAIKQRGIDENSGAEGAFRKSVHNIENLLQQSNAPLALTAVMLQIRRSEKDFLMRRQEKYVQSVHALVERLKTETAASALAGDVQANVVALAGTYTQRFDELVAALKRLDALQVESDKRFTEIDRAIAQYVNNKEQLAALFRWLSIIAMVLGMSMAVWLAVRLARSVATPVEALSLAAERVANGDLSATIAVNARDELSRLAWSFNLMMENIRAMTNELQSEKESVERKVQEAVQQIESDRSYLTSSVETMLRGMERFAQGDLTVRFEAKHNDDNDKNNTGNNDLERLYLGFNRALADVEEALRSVHAAALSASRAGETIAEESQELNAGAQSQSRQSASVARSVETMAQSVNQTLDNVNAVTMYAKQASDNARDGVRTVEQTTSGINAIVEATKQMELQIAALTERIGKIDEIAAVIREIADQTNLLSLNAAIEAARAGEQGRGFAVVADEVKKLAERTTAATKEITYTISAVQDESRKANSLMNTARMTVSQGIEMTQSITYMFEEIFNDALRVSDAIGQVQERSARQRSMSEEVSANVQNIASVAMQSEENIRRLAEVAEQLRASMANVQSYLEHFHFMMPVQDGRNQRSLANGHTPNGTSSDRHTPPRLSQPHHIKSLPAASGFVNSRTLAVVPSLN
jgi:methyl-accepting chemotaxis protein